MKMHSILTKVAPILAVRCCEGENIEMKIENMLDCSCCKSKAGIYQLRGNPESWSFFFKTKFDNSSVVSQSRLTPGLPYGISEVKGKGVSLP